jgi:hypothetical protein
VWIGIALAIFAGLVGLLLLDVQQQLDEKVEIGRQGTAAATKRDSH